MGRLSHTGIFSTHLRLNMGDDMSHVMRQISADTGRDEHTLQNFQKECPSGQMTPEDFAKLYEKVFSHPVPVREGKEVIDFTHEEKLRIVFRLYDKNGNGSLDSREMDEFIRDTYQMFQMLGEDSHGKAQDMLSMMDRDGDGNITEQGFVRAALETGALQDPLNPYIVTLAMAM